MTGRGVALSCLLGTVLGLTLAIPVLAWQQAHSPTAAPMTVEDCVTEHSACAASSDTGTLPWRTLTTGATEGAFRVYGSSTPSTGLWAAAAGTPYRWEFPDTMPPYQRVIAMSGTDMDAAEVCVETAALLRCLTVHDLRIVGKVRPR